MATRQLSKEHKPRVYITRRVPQPGVDLLQTECDLSFWDSDEAISHQDLITNIAGVDALFCMLTDEINAEVLDAAGPNLKVVATMSVGFEHIDIQECKNRGIKVTNTPNVSTDSVAEFTVAILLSASRRLLEGVNAVKAGQWGKWKPMWLLGTELHNSVVGILGFGRIGYGVARRLKPFGVSRLVYSDVGPMGYAADLGAEFVTFDEMVRESDFICICCNLTPQTRNKFNKKVFEKMKNSAILVNTGRGGIIHHEDLYQALKDNVIGGAALDVTEPEPLPANSPLLELSNCIIAPHMGSNTWQSRNLMSETTARNILAVFHHEDLIGEVV